MATSTKSSPALTQSSKEMPVSLPKMTYEEFLDWADEDTYAEWVEGEVITMSPASTCHQDLAGLLYSLMRHYAEDNDAGKVIIAPFQMKLTNMARGREPDLLFITKDHLARLQTNFLDGPADLVIEIVSPESILRDRGAKYAEYEMGGVQEYWIIDPSTQRADFFIMDKQGRYKREDPDANGRYQSTVLPGFWLKMEWLWQEPLPTVRQVLREWEEYTQ